MQFPAIYTDSSLLHLFVLFHRPRRPYLEYIEGAEKVARAAAMESSP